MLTGWRARVFEGTMMKDHVIKSLPPKRIWSGPTRGLLFALFTGVFANPPSFAAITYVQGNYNVTDPASSRTVTFTGAQSAGNLNVVFVGWLDSTTTVTSVTDTKGNVYTRAVGPTISSGNAQQSVYYAKNIAAAAAGANTVTI